MSRIVNLKHEPALAAALARHPVHAGTVLIDRRTKWGNPYRIGHNATREQVIELYRLELWRRIRSGEIALDELAGLAPMRLSCWCHPKPCHGDVLARAADWAAARLGG